jgi:hypothetical protein
MFRSLRLAQLVLHTNVSIKLIIMLKHLTLLAAAVASVAAAPQRKNVSIEATGYWYTNIDHTGDFKGRAPYVDNPDSYEVFKTVDVGDGNAIQNAIDSGGRHQQWLALEPRVDTPLP